MFFLACAFLYGWVLVTHPHEGLLDYLAIGCFLFVFVMWIGVLYTLYNSSKVFQFLFALLSSGVILVCCAPILGILANSCTQDDFGKEHPIPVGMECNTVLADSVVPAINEKDRDSFLQIKQGSQGGIYLYDFYYPALEAGEIYLRCYEATQNIPLSEKRVKKASEVSVSASHVFGKVVDNQQFTIYEGDWGDLYAVRVEVWHKNRQTGKEKKLVEKIYAMEGWMR